MLITGGEFQSSVFNSAELYDPNAGQWTSDPASQDRLHHTATLLPDGKVLVAGGRDSTGKLPSDAQTYDPETHGWTASGPLAKARYAHTATLLPGGKVLVVGGQDAHGNALSDTEEHDPKASTPETWTASDPLAQPRYAHTATLLPGGKVLVVGGMGSTGTSLSSVEEYDPSTRQWTSSSPLTHTRYAHTATLLPGGKVLVVGGMGSTGAPLSSVEEYDPRTRQWTLSGPLAQARYAHTATLLPNGKVLVAGGQAPSSDTAGAPLTSAELYDPVRRQWESTVPLNAARFQHTATLLFSGKVLIARGQGPGATVLTSAEVYDPDLRRWSVTDSFTARANHQATLLTNGQVLVTGGGSSGVELYEETGEDTGRIREWRPALTGAERKEDKLEITGMGLCGQWEASGGSTQNSATNVPRVSLMSVEGGALTRLALRGQFSNEALTPLMPDVPEGHYILSVMANAIHGGRMVLLKGSNLAAPEVTEPRGFVNTSRPPISGKATAGTRVTVWLNGVMAGTAEINEKRAWSFTPTHGLPDGPYKVYATATDTVGNVSPPSEIIDFTIDTQAPAAPEVMKPGAFVNTQMPVISGKVALECPGCVVTVMLDESEAGTVTPDTGGNWSFSVTRELPAEAHHIMAKVTDAAGNVSPWSTRSFMIDLDSPEAPLVVTPGDAVNTRRPIIAGEAEYPGTVLVWLNETLAGTAVADPRGTWSFIPDKDLEKGSNKVHAFAKDLAGNISPASMSRSFVVDIDPPDRPKVSEPGDWTNDNTPKIAGTAASDSLVTVFLDDVKQGTTRADVMGDWSFTLESELDENRYKITATATDAASNVSERSETRVFEVDIRPPNEPMVRESGNNILGFVNTDTPTMSGEAEAYSTVTVWLDGTRVGSIEANSAGGWEFKLTSPVAQGPHQVKVTATDKAKNDSPYSKEFNFTVDSNPPLAPVVLTPESSVNSATPLISGTAEENSKVTVWMNGDEEATVTVDKNGNWSFRSPRELGFGQHSVYAVATDAADNVSPESKHQFAVQEARKNKCSTRSVECLNSAGG